MGRRPARLVTDRNTLAPMTDLANLDATAQADLVRSGDAQPIELVDAAIARIEALNDELNAVIHPLFDRGRALANGALPAGPFRGVPIVVKDLDGTLAGAPYHGGNVLLKSLHYVPDVTSSLFAKLEAAGFVIVGKTNTPELGLMTSTEPLAHGPTHNPWDTTRTPGGSSGGSGAAVASGMVPLAHAGDGGGSIRIPSSMCGLFGLKPSRGRTSLGPDYSAIDDMLVSELCVSRSVRDTAGVLDALHGPAAGDTLTAPAPRRPYVDELGADPGRLRIGIVVENTLGTGDVHPDCLDAVRDAAALLESLGHVVEPAYPGAIAKPELVGVFTTLWIGTLAYNVRYWERKVGRELTPADVEPLTWTMAELGRATPAVDYVDAQHQLLDLTREVEEWFASGYDLLLTPTLGEPPVQLGEFSTPEEPMLGFLRAGTFVPFTPLANMSGAPAISLPLWWNEQGLPIGSQLMAGYAREDLLLRVASQLETARPWAGRRPPVHA